MGSKKKLSHLAQRVVLLRERLAEGSSSRFAELVGCTPGAISHIVNARYEPGATILKRIARLPDVNAHWLKTGDGEPILDERTIPVADRLLPDPIARSGGCFTTERHSAQLPFSSASMYAIRACHAMGSELRAELLLQPRDILIVETDLKQRRQNLDSFNDKLCCVKQKKTASGLVRLERIVATGQGELRVLESDL
jgi:transcriptional regulator with XRE-family HTH domain